TAKTAVEQARKLASGATRRERQHVEALATIAGGEGARGLGLIEEHVQEFPRDALLVNQAASTIGLSGREDREQYRVAFVERLASDYGDEWVLPRAPQHPSRLLRDGRQRGRDCDAVDVARGLRPPRPVPLPSRLAPGAVRAP